MIGPEDSSLDEIASRVIGDLGVVVLESDGGSNGDRGFRLVGQEPPPWFEACFGSASEFCERSAFLDDFVHGAGSDFWRGEPGSSPDSLRSGMWEEVDDAGESHYFEARALRSGTSDLLLIISSDEQHRQETRFVQHAHDEALQQRRLDKEREKKEILLDCIVHDLSSPLSTIMMTVQHVHKRLEDDRLREILDRAMSQAQRQRNLIHSIADVFSSDLSAFESALVGRRRGVEIAAVARELTEAHEAAAGEKGVRLEFDGGGIEESVTGDRDHLGRVFDNLISNAVRHSPGGAPVRVSLRRVGDRIEAAVEDEGPGIPAEDRRTIFRAFTQGGGGETGKSGLGLYFCQMVVEVWGGSIGVEDGADGKGARFWFRLPIVAS